MNPSIKRDCCLMVTGFDKDIHRKDLKCEFQKFGIIAKLYLDNLGEFAKVYYTDKQSCDNAIRSVNNSDLNWKVEYFLDIPLQNSNSSFQQFIPLESSSSTSAERDTMAAYDEYCDDDNYVENFDYCNIHGHPLVVLEAESGDLYVNLKDIKQTGFALFRRDTFNPVLVDKRQISREFELYLASAAQNYILRNRAAIDEDQILQTIQRVKSKLLGNNTPNETRHFGEGRSVIQSPQSNNIIVKSQIQSKPSVVPETPQQRPPKKLPNNFTQTNSINETPTNRLQKHDLGTNSMQNVKDGNTQTNEFSNGFDLGNNKSRRGDDSFSSSTSSDSKKSGPRRSKSSSRNNEKQTAGGCSGAEEIAKLVLEIGQTYDVQVTFVDKEKVCWVQDMQELQMAYDMLVSLSDLAEDLEDTKPVIGKLVIALYEDAWYRGRVISIDPLKVFFIDYGNTSIVKAVKPLPDAVKGTRALAARITINTDNNTVVLKDNDEFKIKVKRQYDGGTYLVVIINTESMVQKKTLHQQNTSPEEKKVKCSEEFYFTKPLPLMELKDGDLVKIIDFEGSKLFVRTQDCFRANKELVEYIKRLDKSDLILTNVKVGQLVLCGKEGMTGFFRAVVCKKESESIVKIKYVDYTGEDKLLVNSLRNVDKFLSEQPSTLLPTPEFKSLLKMTQKTEEFITKLINDKKKLQVVLSNNNFDLKLEDGLLLSKVLINLECPKQVTEKQEEVKMLQLQVAKEESSSSGFSSPGPSSSGSSLTGQSAGGLLSSESLSGPSSDKTPLSDTALPKTSLSSKKTFFASLKEYEMEEGICECFCYSFRALNDVTLNPLTPEGLDYLETITDVEVSEDVPYEPECLEMCLVYDKGSSDTTGGWYRATVTDVQNKEYTVTFVDFGNKLTVKSNIIREFPAHLKDIPILGLKCECVGIPFTPEVNELVKKPMTLGEQIEVLFRGKRNGKYRIELPQIYKQLNY